MEQLYPMEPNKKILLTATDSGLYAYTFVNDRLHRPVLLCSNYQSDLSCTPYNDSLYYAYINKDHSLLLRCLNKSALQFRLDCNETVTYHTPKLLVFHSFLLLFYFEQTKGTYRLRIRAPFADLPPLSFPEGFPACFTEFPILRMQTTPHHLYLFLSAGTDSFLFRYPASFSPEVLSTEEQLLSRFLPAWEAEKKQLAEQLRQVTQQLQFRQAELEEKNTVLQELEQTSLLLERAKAQYEELRQVAEQYKKEAEKWYYKFTDRH